MKSSSDFSLENKGSTTALRADFADAAHWDALIEQPRYHHQLPPWDRPWTWEEAREWLKRLGVTPARYRQWCGGRLRDFGRLNPRWPLRAWVGLVLELTEEET